MKKSYKKSLPLLSLGGAGVISVLSNIMPRERRQLMESLISEIHIFEGLAGSIGSRKSAAIFFSLDDMRRRRALHYYPDLPHFRHDEVAPGS